MWAAVSRSQSFAALALHSHPASKMYFHSPPSRCTCCALCFIVSRQACLRLKASREIPDGREAVRAWWLTGDRVVTKTSAAALSPNGAFGAGGIILMQSAGDQRIYILARGDGMPCGASLVKTFGREQVILIDVDERTSAPFATGACGSSPKGGRIPESKRSAYLLRRPMGQKSRYGTRILATKAYSNAEALAGLSAIHLCLYCRTVMTNGWTHLETRFTVWKMVSHARSRSPAAYSALLEVASFWAFARGWTARPPNGRHG